MNENNNAQTILEAGWTTAEARRVPEPVNGEGAPYTVIPATAKIERLDALLPHPLRRKGRLTFWELPSFAAYVMKHADDATVLFCDPQAEPIQFTAIFDHHTAGEAGWGEHRATFAPRYAPEYTRWKEKNLAWLPQADFAEFLQDNLLDLTHPPGAHLLEIAQELLAKKAYDYRSAVNLRDGTVQFHYVETLETSGGAKGTLTVPYLFALGIPLHAGGPLFPIDGRLKFKIDDKNKLLFRYELVRLAQVITRVHDELRASVEHATKLPVLAGVSN